MNQWAPITFSAAWPDTVRLENCSAFQLRWWKIREWALILLVLLGVLGALSKCESSGDFGRLCWGEGFACEFISVTTFRRESTLQGREGEWLKYADEDCLH